MNPNAEILKLELLVEQVRTNAAPKPANAVQTLCELAQEAKYTAGEYFRFLYPNEPEEPDSYD